MARVRFNQKSHRVLDFLGGLGNRQVRRALVAQGFTREDLEEGWSRLRAISELPEAPDPVDPAEQLLAMLQAWVSRWHPVCEIVLRLNFPGVYEVVFHRLRRPDGVEVVASMTVLIERLEKIPRPEEEGGLGEEGRAARALLAKRKLTDDVLAQGRRLLERVGREPEQLTETELQAIDRAAREAAEERLWTWYLEWSALARLVIRDKTLLRALGFRPRRGSDADEET